MSVHPVFFSVLSARSASNINLSTTHMNIINEALNAAIRCENFSEKGGTAQLFFATDFAGFDGHFEGSPVVPGVCLVQALVHLSRRKAGRDLRIKSLRLVKFFRPVLPETTVDFEFKLSEENGVFSCRGSAENDEGKIAKISMELNDA